MDTTEQNIKMLEKAIELQDREPQIGDCWIFQGETQLEDMIICRGDEWYESLLRPWCNYTANEAEYKTLIKQSIWIPHQDQLQDKLIEAGVDTWELGLYAPNFFVAKDPNSPAYHAVGSSPEMALLQLLFFKQFNKVWSSDIGDWKEPDNAS